MSAADRLYTPELLGLAVELAEWPPLETAHARGEARSPTCGSTLAIDLALDAQSKIERLGLRVRACAVGQAAAAVFARHAIGRGRAGLDRDLKQIEAWLGEGGPAPAWPDWKLIEAARPYPGRHGAIRLPWKAALAALSTPAASG